jgi:hypothetical protein
MAGAKDTRPVATRMAGISRKTAPNRNPPQNRILSSISRPHLSPNLGRVDELGRTHDSPFSGPGEIS